MKSNKTRKYLFLAEYLRKKFGVRVQKVPLDAGFTCPNRDGALSTKGCVFCNESGSGTGLWAQGLSLADQWQRITPSLERKYNTNSFLAYLQAFSNTYGPAERLTGVIQELRGLPGLRGLCIGTRPDCLDQEKTAILAGAGFEELWLEMGLQSASNATLERINRGHDAECFAEACRMATKRGVAVCAHLIAGLPGEGRREFLDSVNFAAGLGIKGYKFHNLYVCKGTSLAQSWRRGEFSLPEREEYAAWISEALEMLPVGAIIHRLASDPAPGELLAPQWAADKNSVVELIRKSVPEGSSRGL